jgi:hypothetical protein
MPVPFAIALIGFALTLVGMGVLRPLVARAAAADEAQRPRALEETFDALLAGVALVSVVMVLLGIFGLFSRGSIAALAGLCGAAGWWTARAGVRVNSIRWSATLLVVVSLGVAALALGTHALVRPYEAQVNSSDASLYLGAAAHLADGGGFVGRDPLVAEMTPDERRQFFAKGLFNTGRAGAYYHRFPGGVQLLDADGSAVSFNFYHLWPAWLAIGLKLMGSPGFLAILSLFVAVSAISLFLVGRLLAGPVFGIASVVVLFSSFPQLHYSRLPISEMLAQALFLAGLFCFLRAIQASASAQLKHRILAGALWGCMSLTRADAALMLFPTLFLSFLVVPRLRRSVGDWLPMTLPLVALTGLAILHQIAVNAYETPFANSDSIGEAVRSLTWGIRDYEPAVVTTWLAVIVLAAMLASRSRALRTAVAAMSSFVFVLAAFVWFLAFPASVRWEAIQQHSHWLALYLPNPALIAIVIGLAVLAIAGTVRPSGRGTIGLLFVFLAVPLATFVINPMVTAVQPWAIRRFVPMGFPLLLTCALLGFEEGFSILAARIGDRFRYAYLLAAAVIIVFLAPQAAVLWRQPLYRDIGSQLDQIGNRIPGDALVVMPYSMAGIAVAVNYGERRAALMLPLEAGNDAAPGPDVVKAYIARQLSAGRKVVALLRQPPDPSQVLASSFDLRPAAQGDISYFQLPQVGASQFPGSTGEAHIPYRIFDVYSPGAAPPVDAAKAESSREELWRHLAAGLDFTKPTLPADVVSLTGLSGFEARGRWTEGPVTRFQFADPLPRRFSLELDIGDLYARDRSVPLKVIVGDQSKDLHLPEHGGTVRLDFAPSTPTDAIEIRIPNPVSPKSRGESADPRELGIRLKSLRVLASTAQDLTEGIDFSNARLPAFVAALDGISGYEPRGRWTDGAVARIKLREPLPPRFTLEIVVADVYEPNRGEPITVRIGGEAKAFQLDRAPATVRLSFAPAHPVDTIVLEIPRPTSPASKGESADSRKLGLRLQAIRILAPDR